MFLHSLKDVIEKIEQRQWRGTFCQVSNGVVQDADSVAALMQNWRLRTEDLKFGDTVVVLADRSVEAIALLFQCWQRGITVVPLEAETPLHAQEKIATHANAAAVIDCKTGMVTLRPSIACKTIAFAQTPKVTAVDTALIIYTSGSTGDPKGIALTHQNVVCAMHAISEYLYLDEAERILCISPLCFDYGLYQTLFALLKDAHVVLFDEPFTPVKAIKAINDYEITLLPTVPSMANSILKGLQVYKKSIPTLSKLTNTGGHLPNETIAGYLALMPELNIFPMYGLTESKRALYLSPTDVKKKPGSVGKPMPGLAAIVLKWCDTSLQWQECGANEVGELCVRGGTVMQGYLGMDNDERVFIQGRHPADRWLRTGDLFRVDEDGYFYFVERAKSLIKQGGYCLYPQNIVKDLAKCPLIEEAAVVGSMENGQEIAIGFLVGSKIVTPADQKWVKDWITQHIEHPYIPARLEFINALPLNVNGKVDKKQLLAEVADHA